MIMFFAIIGFVVMIAAIAYGLTSLFVFVINHEWENRRKKREEREDEEYYRMYIDDELNKAEEYIKKVINSCKTHDQLHNTRIWLYGYYRRMRETYERKGNLAESCRLIFTPRLNRHLDTIHDMHAKIIKDNILA